MPEPVTNRATGNHNAADCQAALVDGGEADLWSVMEQIYRERGIR